MISIAWNVINDAAINSINKRFLFSKATGLNQRTRRGGTTGIQTNLRAAVKARSVSY